MNKNRYFIVLSVSIFLIFFFISCHRKKNIRLDSKIVYNDIKLLSKILDFSIYKPDSVLFKYRTVLNSIEGKQPFFLPTPKDYILEAILYFNSGTMQNLRNEIETDLLLKKSENTKQNFTFNWLPNSIAEELKQKDTVNEYAADIFFNTGSSKMIILNNKIIIYAYTN